jgi:hypothetical protein
MLSDGGIIVTEQLQLQPQTPRLMRTVVDAAPDSGDVVVVNVDAMPPPTPVVAWATSDTAAMGATPSSPGSAADSSRRRRCGCSVDGVVFLLAITQAFVGVYLLASSGYVAATGDNRSWSVVVVAGASVLMLLCSAMAYRCAWRHATASALVLAAMAVVLEAGCAVTLWLLRLPGGFPMMLLFLQVHAGIVVAVIAATVLLSFSCRKQSRSRLRDAAAVSRARALERDAAVQQRLAKASRALANRRR